MAGSLALKIAVSNTPHVAALKDGRIAIDGVDADFVNVQPQIAAFRRMVRDVEFDVCELAPTTYVIARAHGAPFKALPIFLMRRFHHSGLAKRNDAGINRPKDLEGKRVGVRAYSVTTGVWTRGILQNEYDVDPDKVNWVVDDEEHVQTMKLPPNVSHVEEGKSLASMMAAGELQAGFTGPAGIGRAGAPTAGWNSGGIADDAYPEVIEDAAEAEAEWYRRTGIYPIHGTLVVKDEVLDANPWLPKALLEAFDAAKQPYLAQLAKGEGEDATTKRYIQDAKVVGPDPLPYGMAANLASVDALIQYAYQQRLIDKLPDRDSLFVNI